MAYLDTHLRQSLSGRLLGWLSPDIPKQPAETPAPATWQQNLFADVGRFLFSNGLDPTPDNYDLAYQFCAAHNVDLVEAVRSEIEQAGALASDAAERILASSAGPIRVEALSALAEQIEAQAQGLTDIAIRSAGDAGHFRSELESASIADSEASQILELTKEMVSRTRLAEVQLRQAHKELDVLKSSLADAQHAADIDPLTGVFNRRAFKRHLERVIELAKRNGDPVSIAFCDIDHFKRFNDLHGHATGDRVLRHVASKLTKAAADKGFVGRFGGEEFVVAFAGLPLSVASEMIDQARYTLSQRRLKSATNNTVLGCVTFSAGVATLGESDSMTEMLRRADDALYKAKSSGRDRVEQESSEVRSAKDLEEQ